MKITETRIFNSVNSFIMGKHPHNTIFAFNYHNVRHIVSFLSNAVQNHLPANQYTIADIGAGRSPYYFLFSEKASKYIAIDFKESLPAGETRAIEQIAGTAESIPLEDNSVDVVLCNQVFEHVEDPVQSASEMFRIIKPGGVFLGSVPHVSPIHLEPYDYWRFTELGVKKLLSKAGFEDIRVSGNGGVHRCVALILSMDWFLSKRKEGGGSGFIR